VRYVHCRPLWLDRRGAKRAGSPSQVLASPLSQSARGGERLAVLLQRDCDLVDCPLTVPLRAPIIEPLQAGDLDICIAARRENLRRVAVKALSLPNLRHTFASLLIAGGANVSHVQGQPGHASPDITLRVYTHEFNKAAHEETTRAALDAVAGNSLVTSAAKAEEASVVPLAAFQGKTKGA
jgi:integrase